MRPLEELLSDDPAWPEVQSWLAQATNPAAVLPTDRARGEDVLYRIQMTSRSTLGAVALETGGLLVDHGWLRILGAGGPRMNGNLASWNGLAERSEIGGVGGAMIVAHDAVGGFFALNGGGFGPQTGDVFYFAPDTLEWEELGRGYSDFLYWVLTGDLGGFYEALRWPTWREDASTIGADFGFSLVPPPFTKEGKLVANASRRPVPMVELWGIYQDYAHQL